MLWLLCHSHSHSHSDSHSDWISLERKSLDRILNLEVKVEHSKLPGSVTAFVFWRPCRRIQIVGSMDGHRRSQVDRRGGEDRCSRRSRRRRRSIIRRKSMIRNRLNPFSLSLPYQLTFCKANSLAVLMFRFLRLTDLV